MAGTEPLPVRSSQGPEQTGVQVFTAARTGAAEYTERYKRTGLPRGKVGKGYFSWVLKDEQKFSRWRERGGIQGRRNLPV